MKTMNKPVFAVHPATRAVAGCTSRGVADRLDDYLQELQTKEKNYDRKNK